MSMYKWLLYAGLSALVIGVVGFGTNEVCKSAKKKVWSIRNNDPDANKIIILADKYWSKILRVINNKDVRFEVSGLLEKIYWISHLDDISEKERNKQLKLTWTNIEMVVQDYLNNSWTPIEEFIKKTFGSEAEDILLANTYA